MKEKTDTGVMAIVASVIIVISVVVFVAASSQGYRILDEKRKQDIGCVLAGGQVMPDCECYLDDEKLQGNRDENK